MGAKAPAQEIHQVISTAVDGAFYRAVYPDLAIDGVDPIAHYVALGWREGRDPAPWFSTKAYVTAYPEVTTAGWNPLHHYLTQGRREGRDVARSTHADAYLRARLSRGQEPAWRFESLSTVRDADEIADAALERHRQSLLAATEFDVAYYLKINKDVADAGVDPLEHFLVGGWRENRDPNAQFSVKDYLESYPDIAQAGVNPFVHFLERGRAEGRTAKLDLGFRFEIIRRLAPVDARLAVAVRASARVALGTAAALKRGLAAALTGLADLHITFSHDDYTANMGGVQVCLRRESAQAAELGRDHLHIYPAKAWPVVRARGEPAALGVLLNGRRIGVFAPKTIQGALGQAAGTARPGRRSFAIHSLLGHNAAETVDILAAAGLREGYFWLHDFASLCAGFHLLRDDVEDCAAPPADSMACGICVYGPWRARHMTEHERLFERLALTVVSPSQPTLDLWKDRTACRSRSEVLLPHARLVDRGPAPATPDERPLRIAYVGIPTPHKGWEIFRDLVKRYGEDPRYRFFHLGGRAVAGLPLSFHKVTVTQASPRAMQDAVARHEIDVAIIWPLCRETFSIVAYEAVAAGAAIVTGPDSGNVAAFVAEGTHGLVLPDEAALAALLESGEIAALARARRTPRVYDLAFSGLTFDLLAGDNGEGAA